MEDIRTQLQNNITKFNKRQHKLFELKINPLMLELSEDEPIREFYTELLTLFKQHKKQFEYLEKELNARFQHGRIQPTQDQINNFRSQYGLELLTFNSTGTIYQPELSESTWGTESFTANPSMQRIFLEHNVDEMFIVYRVFNYENNFEEGVFTQTELAAFITENF